MPSSYLRLARVRVLGSRWRLKFSLDGSSGFASELQQQLRLPCLQLDVSVMELVFEIHDLHAVLVRSSLDLGLSDYVFGGLWVGCC